MYLANPILLLGLFGLLMALLLLPWWYRAKTEAMKKSVNGVLTMLLTLGALWSILGTIVGLNHMSVHGDCVKQNEVWVQKREAKAEADRNKAKENEAIAKLTPEQKQAEEAKLTPAQKAERDAKAKAAAEADLAYAEAEKAFMATCNTILTRYAKAP